MKKSLGRKFLGYLQLLEELNQTNSEFYKYGFLISRDLLEYHKNTLNDRNVLKKVLKRPEHIQIINEIEKQNSKTIEW